MATRIDTTHAPLLVPERGPVVRRTLLVMLGALLLAGMLGGVMPLFFANPDDPNDTVTAGMVISALILGAVVGLAAFFLALVPVIITIATTKDWMASSDGRTRLVHGLLWLGLTGLTLAVMAGVLQHDFGQGALLLAPSALLVLLITQLTAPWTIWRRWRRGEG